MASVDGRDQDGVGAGAGVLLGMAMLCVPAAIQQLITARPAVGLPTGLLRGLPGLSVLAASVTEAAWVELSAAIAMAPAWGVVEALNLAIQGLASVISKLAVAVQPNGPRPAAGPFVPPTR